MASVVPAPPRPDVRLVVDDVSLVFRPNKARSAAALDHVSIEAKPGEITGLVGPDGAGKTTLLRLAAGLLAPTDGRVTILGLDSVRETIGIHARVGYMPQQFGLYEELTVQENLDLYSDLQGVPARERSAKYQRLLEMTGLAPFTGRRTGQLSGGMKQKLGLACSLVKSPEMLLLDEPTVGVDPVSRRDLWNIVFELVEKEGIGVVLSTAYLDEADRCHRVIVLHQGRKLAEGPPALFHEQVRGRTWLFTPGAESSPRDAQAYLAARGEVVDATIHSGRVRVVFAAPPADVDELAADALCTAVKETEPNFEDAFVSLLATRSEHGLESGLPTRTHSRAGSPESPEVVVQVSKLSKSFGRFEAVRGISFAVRRGEIFGLLGPNGAGKSTTFRMLCGLLPATGGELRVADRDLRRSGAEARARLGYMAQKFSLYKQLPVVHNLRFYGQAYGLKGKHLRERIDWALDEFHLRDWTEVAAGDLPGGYRQRLAMAAALLHEPDILFLDEPTSGADPLARREFWLRIHGFASRGVTVIVTTHFLEEAESCDRMLIMSRGNELAQGTPAEIRSLARTPDNSEPTVEDAFIALSEGRVKPAGEGESDD